VVLIVLYTLTMLGVTVGYHRLLTHHAFEASPGLTRLLAILGSMAVQGPVINWVADHRRHHAFADSDGDPHSPHAVDGRAIPWFAGLWHAHLGWMLSGRAGLSDPRRYAADLLEDRALRRIDDWFGLIALAGLAIPAALGAAFGGTAQAALSGFLWGGVVRIFLAHHVTWSVNSLCHFSGSRPFDTRDRSTNLPLLAVASMGESWHNNHHAFPRSASHGLRPSQLDPSGWVIAALCRTRFARKPVRISSERQLARRAATRRA
jgi:stearoyl-CoA desaturase (Delta-9 desaturase)